MTVLAVVVNALYGVTLESKPHKRPYFLGALAAFAAARSFADSVTEIRSNLMSTVLEGNFYDIWFKHLMSQVIKGDARALVVFRDTFLGRPAEVNALAQVNANSVQMMFANALAPRDTNPTERKIDDR